MGDVQRRKRKPKKRLKRVRDVIPDSQDFWRTKSADELAEEQGIKPVKDIEEIVGKGKNLWKSDEDLDRFLEDVRRRRHGLDSASREDLEKELAMRDAKRQTRSSEKQSKTGRRSEPAGKPSKKPGHKHVRVEDLMGKGKDLWRSDKEFDEFVAGIYARRRQGRKR